MNQFSIQTKTRTQFIDITPQVQTAVQQLGRRDGSVIVLVPHTTAGITINENADPDVMRDMETILERLVPWNGSYRHSEGNSAAHAKASLMGSSVQAPVVDGQIALGTWQCIYFCEFDGPRHRQVWII